MNAVNKRKQPRSLRPLIAVAILFVIHSAFGGGDAEPKHYTYDKLIDITADSVGGAGTLTLVVGHKSRAQYNDFMVDAQDCSNDNYECFQSALFSFAVPKILSAATTGWQAGSQRYEIVRLYPEYRIGPRIMKDVFVIQASIQPSDNSGRFQRRVLFYYSNQVGLLGFAELNTVGVVQGQTPVEQTVTVFALRGLCGFASAAGCVAR